MFLLGLACWCFENHTDHNAEAFRAINWPIFFFQDASQEACPTKRDLNHRVLRWPKPLEYPVEYVPLSICTSAGGQATRIPRIHNWWQQTVLHHTPVHWLQQTDMKCQQGPSAPLLLGLIPSRSRDVSCKGYLPAEGDRTTIHDIFLIFTNFFCQIWGRWQAEIIVAW
jgi:hypothetical protein